MIRAYANLASNNARSEAAALVPGMEKAAMAWRGTMAASNGDKGPERGVRPLSKSDAAGTCQQSDPRRLLRAGDEKMRFQMRLFKGSTSPAPLQIGNVSVTRAALSPGESREVGMDGMGIALYPFGHEKW
jgi:hypothetical protein